MAKRIILQPGEVFGRWTVISHAMGEPKALCECSCGTVREISTYNLRKGLSKSCGCLAVEKIVERSTKHGYSKRGDNRHPLAKVWQGMKTRCSNPNQIGYKNYGGRGIFVCKGWSESLESFIHDMGDRPKGGTIERIQNEFGYTCGHCKDCIEHGYPANCKWASNYEQQRNKRVNHLIEFNGKIQCLQDWANETGISQTHILHRLKTMSVEEALTLPVKPQRGADIFIEFNGVTKSLPEWSRELGIKYLTLYHRLYTHKWSVERSFTTPVRVR